MGTTLGHSSSFWTFDGSKQDLSSRIAATHVSAEPLAANSDAQKAWADAGVDSPPATVASASPA